MFQRMLLPLLFVAYFGLLSLFRFDVTIWQLWLGAVFGMVLLVIDRLVYTYVTYPEEPLSQEVRNLVRMKQFGSALTTLWSRRDEQVRTTTRSFFFMGMWIPLALYVITSTGSLIGSGMIMAIGLYLAYELMLVLHNTQLMQQKFFWMVQRPMSQQELYGAAGVFLFFFVLFTTLFL